MWLPCLGTPRSEAASLAKQLRRPAFDHGSGRAQQSRRPALGGPSPRNYSKAPAPSRTPDPRTVPASPPPKAQPQRRPTYDEAVALYEQALRTLQQHNFGKAADLLQHVIATFPEERELIERSRLYLTLCERQLKPPTAEPQNTPERLYAATIALNDGDLDGAVAHLEYILRNEPSHDQALYMLSVAQSERGELEDAIRYLEQAIEANPENRALARLDPDLDDLREEDAVIALLAGPAPRSGDHRRAARRR